MRHPLGVFLKRGCDPGRLPLLLSNQPMMNFVRMAQSFFSTKSDRCPEKVLLVDLCRSSFSWRAFVRLAKAELLGLVPPGAGAQSRVLFSPPRPQFFQL